VAVLEGGYDLKALADGGRAVVDELGREADEPIEAKLGNPRIAPLIDRARQVLSPYWRLT
jgi:hypothetical protein